MPPIQSSFGSIVIIGILIMLSISFPPFGIILAIYLIYQVVKDVNSPGCMGALLIPFFFIIWIIELFKEKKS